MEQITMVARVGKPK